MYISCNNEVHLCNSCCSTGAIIIPYCESVFVALGIQHVMCTHHTVICDLSGYSIFFHIISSMARFLKIKILKIKCVFWFSLQLLSETFLILGRTERDIIKNVYRCSHKVHVVLVWLMNVEFSHQAFEKKFMKRHQVGAESFQADMMQVTVAFHKCMTAPNYWMNFDEIC